MADKMAGWINNVECLEASGALYDLVGTRGMLRLDKKCTESAVNWYDGGMGVCFERKRTTMKGGVCTVHTKLGNRLVFKVKEVASEAKLKAAEFWKDIQCLQSKATH